MPAETELKYAPPADFSADRLFSLPEIAPHLGEIKEFAMKTDYLDTPFSDAKARGITLRRRFENGKSILYAKTSRLRSNELSIRGEWSVESGDIANAAKILCAVGAPTNELVGLQLEVCGKVVFTRHEALLTLPAFSASLSYDEGTFGESVPFSEIELELVSGDTDELLRFGRDLSQKYNFSPEPSSKYARAILHTTKQNFVEFP